MIRKIIAGPRIIAEVIGGNGPEQLQQCNKTQNAAAVLRLTTMAPTAQQYTAG